MHHSPALRRHLFHVRFQGSFASTKGIRTCSVLQFMDHLSVLRRNLLSLTIHGTFASTTGAPVQFNNSGIICEHKAGTCFVLHFSDCLPLLWAHLFPCNHSPAQSAHLFRLALPASFASKKGAPVSSFISGIISQHLGGTCFVQHFMDHSPVLRGHIFPSHHSPHKGSTCFV